MESKQTAIEVISMSKDFKRVYDKPNTLKERLVFWKKNKYELHHVLKDINIEINKGETVALIGTNGSGKSTLLKLMTKILYPTKGKIKTTGKLTSLLELGAGFHPDFTGRENIYFNASVFGLTRSDIDKRIDSIIEFSELGDFIDNPVRTYSSGMYMRLAFSVAINVDAEILLIDEILGVGDQYFQEKCFSKLEELRDSDKTIVIVSHSLSTVKKLCKRCIWLYKGEVKLDGESKHVIDTYLNQIIEDHKNAAQPIVEKNKYLGELTIDHPKNNESISNDENILIDGWELSDTPDSVVDITIDGKKQKDVKRIIRKDVMTILGDKYCGYAANKTPGFVLELPKNTLSIGKHKLLVVSKDKKNQVIDQKEINFSINNGSEKNV